MKLKNSKIYIFWGIIFFVLSILYFSSAPVIAYNPQSGSLDSGGSQGITIISPSLSKLLGNISKINLNGTNADKARDKASYSWKTATTNALYTALESGLKNIAYDTAKYIGSGGEGQKPLFIKENWGVYLTNIADNAAGTFIEEMGNDPNFFGQFDLCKPNVDLKILIPSLIAPSKSKPECTFSEMKKNWSSEMQRGDFLNRFQNMFEPSSNDLSIALTLSTKASQQEESDLNEATLLRMNDNGWISKGLDALSGQNESPPGESARQVENAEKSFMEVLSSKDWKDPFVGAAKVFIVQLLYSSFQKLMANLGSDASNFTTSYKGNALNNYASSPAFSSNIASKKMKFVEPNFTVRGDYKILSELSQCPNIKNAGPTECVITEKFREAISQKLTVKEALDQGYLDGDVTFGYSKDGIEPLYNEGYPYRTMVILRKFRILPVGWELAAQYIKKEIDSGTNTNKKVYTLNDVINGYNDSSSPFYKLVEPNWVLKAPQNYCAKEGPGPQIIEQHTTGKGDESELSITRNDNYCADEKTCISEGENGECNYFGYCTKEQRAWESSLKSCDDVYNTCEEYKRSNGDTVAYLENTLTRLINCNKPGCREYRTPLFKSVSNNAIDVTYSQDDNLNPVHYFVKDKIKKCDKDDEGCHAYIRTKDKIGANLIEDSSFEGSDSGYQVSNSFYNSASSNIVDDKANAYDGSHYFDVNSSNSFEFPLTDYNVAGYKYTFSFYSNCDNANWDVEGESDPSDPTIDNKILIQGDINNTDWALNYDTIIFPKNYTNVKKIKFNINNNGSSCHIDAFKVERGDVFNQYDDYMDTGMVHEKLMPDYLDNANICGSSSPPQICSDFIATCTKDQVWCDMYTTNDGYNIPAKIIAQDECPSECVGFDTYTQAETEFDSEREEHFIPKTASICPASAAGCEEFTNIDKKTMGAEQKEYYSYLRRCVKPEDALLSSSYSCKNYNLWSDKAGSELISVSLKTSNGDIDVWDNSGDCNATIYNMSISNPSYNYDCRKFQDQDGKVYYKLYSKTISCDDNCHPFKMTRENFDNSGNKVCINGGVWQDDIKACVYNGIAEESTECKPSQDGCREYSGSQGFNENITLSEDFEGGGTYPEWNNKKVTINAKTGNSYIYNDTDNEIKLDVSMGSKIFEKGYAYKIQFITYNNSANDTTITVSYVNADNNSVVFGNSIIPKESKKLIKMNLNDFNIEASSGQLIFKLSDPITIYLDDVKITKIEDKYYLIRNTWKTPDSCNEDIYGNQYANYMLGCDIYSNSDNKIYYLHNFNALCFANDVGCEEVIDTNNTLSDASDDSYKYIMYDKNKQCSAIGCNRFGLTYDYLTNHVYRDMYLQDNGDPDANCSASDDYCEAWTDNNNVTIKVQSPEIKSIYEYKNDKIVRQPVKACRSVGTTTTVTTNFPNMGCDGTGDLGCYCLNDKDCAGYKNGTASCETIDDESYADILKSQGYSNNNKGIITFGTGGYKVPQIIQGAMVCPINQSGCTEYVDIGTSFNPNLINSDGKVTLDPFTMYVGFDSNDNLIASPPFATSTVIKSIGPTSYYYGTSSAEKVDVADGATKVTKTIINYWIDKDVDPSLCSGEDITNGCVGFYYDYSLGTKYKVLKVRPDRKCGEWLTCTSYIKNKDGGDMCLDIGKCNRLTSDGACDNIINDPVTDQVNQTKNNSDISNVSGYVSVGYSDSSNDDNKDGHIPNDLLQFQNMSQSGGVANVTNGSFEFYDDNNIPLGWEKSEVGVVFEKDNNVDCNTAFSVINNPVSAQKENVSYVNNTGRSFLKISAEGAGVSSEFIDVEPNTEYILSADVNSKNFSSASFATDAAYLMSIAMYDKNGNHVIGLNGPSAFSDCDDCSYSSAAAADVNIPSVRFDSDNWKRVFIKFKTGNDIYKMKIFFRGVVWLGSVTYWNNKCPGIGCQPCTASEAQTSPNTCIPRAPAILCGRKEGPVITSADFYTNNNQGKEGEFIDYTANSDCSDPAVDHCRIISKDVCSGTVYVDNVKMEPVLKARDDKKTLLPQTCRLYPKQDSMSCKYYEDSGIYTKGQYGYCLKYDSYPGNSKACLLWWPVDLVEGQSISGDELNMDRFPLYYCASADMNFTILERRQEVKIYEESLNNFSGWFTTIFTGGLSLIYDLTSMDNFDFSNNTLNLNTQSDFDPSLMLAGGIGGTSINDYSSSIDIDTGKWKQCHGAGCGECPFGYYLRKTMDKSGFLSMKAKLKLYCTPVASEQKGPPGWYEYNGDLQKIDGSNGSGSFDEGDYGLMVYFNDTGETMSYEEARSRNIIMQCKDIYQTVGATGENKAWWGRVQDGSDFITARTVAYAGSSISSLSDIVMDTYSGMYGAINNSEQGYLNPPDWDGIPDTDAINPVILGYKEAGGTTFGCDKTSPNNNCKVMGICSGGKNNCLAYATGDGLLNGKIKVSYGNSVAKESLYPRMPYDLGAEYGCPDGEVCLPIETYTSDDMKRTFKRIFAQSYGYWRWDKNEGKYVTVDNGNKNWSPPDSICSSNGRPEYQLAGKNSNISGLFVNVGDKQYLNLGYNYSGIKNCSNLDEIFSIKTQKCNTMNSDGSDCLAWDNPVSVSSIGSVYNINDICSNYASSDGNLWSVSVSFPYVVSNGSVKLDSVEIKSPFITSTIDPIDVNEIITIIAATSSEAITNYGLNMPLSNDDYCSIPPRIKNVKFNDSDSYNNFPINLNEPLKLEFESVLDDNQLPLTMYSVDWGDGDITTISGVKIQDGKQDLYHVYSEAGVKNIKIKIRDNWDWYAGGPYTNKTTSYLNGTMSATNAWVDVGSVFVQ